MSKNIKLKNLLKEDMKYAPDEQNLRADTERFGNYKIHKFKNLYNAIGKDLDLAAYDNNGNIIAGGIDKNTFKAKSYEDIVQHLVNFYKANPQAQSVDLSDRETGESLAAMQRTKFDEQKLKEDDSFNYHKHEIDQFLSKADQNSPYKPQIKLNWGGDTGSSSTKWLSIDWGTMIKLANLLKESE